MFRTKTAAEAARIANSVAAAYRDHRAEQRDRSAQEGLAAIETGLAQVDARIRDAQKTADELRVKLTIPVEQPALLLTADTLRRLEQLRIESQVELVRERTLLEKLRQLKSEELYLQLQNMAPADTLMTSLAQGLVVAEQKAEELKKDFGPEHPEVVKAVARVKDYQQRLQQRADGFMVGLDAKVSSLRESLKSLESEIENAKERDIELAGRSRPYWDAKKKVEELQSYRQTLVQTLASQRIAAQLSNRPAVELIEPAVAPAYPRSKRGPGAACMALGLLFSIAGVWLVRSGDGA